MTIIKSVTESTIIYQMRCYVPSSEVLGYLGYDKVIAIAEIRRGLFPNIYQKSLLPISLYTLPLIKYYLSPYP